MELTCIKQDVISWASPVAIYRGCTLPGNETREACY